MVSNEHRVWFRSGLSQGYVKESILYSACRHYWLLFYLILEYPSNGLPWSHNIFTEMFSLLQFCHHHLISSIFRWAQWWRTQKATQWMGVRPPQCLQCPLHSQCPHSAAWPQCHHTWDLLPQEGHRRRHVMEWYILQVNNDFHLYFFNAFTVDSQGASFHTEIPVIFL